jgi:hypothetical protein
MKRHPRSVDQAIERFDDLVSRIDGKVPGAARRDYGRTAKSVGKRVTNIFMALAALIVATIGFGLFVGPIGWTGLFIVALLTMCILVFFAARSTEPKPVAYSEELPTSTVIQQFGSFVGRRRSALPAPAARRLDSIGQQLPLLESRLTEVDALDPLAQDARRLMGKHLPELIERYERVPPAYRSERDGEGLTVDERLVASLDAARTALDDIGVKLAREDLTAFETQGRFIESRYKDGADFKGD